LRVICSAVEGTPLHISGLGGKELSEPVFQAYDIIEIGIQIHPKETEKTFSVAVQEDSEYHPNQNSKEKSTHLCCSGLREYLFRFFPFQMD